MKMKNNGWGNKFNVVRGITG